MQKNGLIDLQVLHANAAITDKTVVVSIMAVNTEIGVIQPLAEIGKICREKKVFFHTDAAQAAGKIPLDVEAMNIDLMSISGHKIYGPKGIGALFVRRKPRVKRLRAADRRRWPRRGFRSGTLPTPLCVGLGEAAEICMKEMDGEAKRLKKLQDPHAEGPARQKLPEILRQRRDLEQRIWACNLNISFAHVEGESLMMGIKRPVRCRRARPRPGLLEPSYVLRALGVEEEMAHTSARASGSAASRPSRKSIHAVADTVAHHITKLRGDEPDLEQVPGGHRHQIHRVGRHTSNQKFEESVMAYSEKLIDHYENPRQHPGRSTRNSEDVGTGLGRRASLWRRS